MNPLSHIFTIVFCAIPEVFFTVSITLFVIGRYDYFSKFNWRENLLKILIKAVIPTTLAFSTLRFFFHGMGFRIIANLIILTIFISVLTEVKSKKEYLRVLLLAPIGFFIFMLTESITEFIISTGLGVTPSIFEQSAILNFIIFIPERLIQYSILTIIFLKQNGLTRINLLKLIFENTYLKMLTIMVTIIDVTILILLVRYTLFEGAMKTLSIKNQLFISISGMSLVIINILTIWIVAMCIYPVEKYKQKYGN